MDAYVYRAELLCPGCADAMIADLKDEGRKDSGDSNDFPQGPDADGGGAADSFQFCDSCGVFLENPLTADGLEHELNCVEDYIVSRGGWNLDKMTDRLEALDSMGLNAPWPKVIELAGLCLNEDRRRACKPS